MNDTLLIRYLTGELTAQETEMLRQELESDPDKRKYLKQMEKIWKRSGSIEDFRSIDAANDWLILKEKFRTPEQTLPGVPTIPFPTKRQFPSRSLTYIIARIAAIALLVLATALMTYYYKGNGPLSKVEWVSMLAHDQQEEIVLPDGSRIFLREGTTLAYPVGFKGKERSVKLDGEAFFEVARNEDKPFVVHIADEATAEVLGTSFNLRADKDNRHVTLNVVSGKVAFYPKGIKKNASILLKDQQAVCAEGSVRNESSIDLNFLSWKTRTIVFENSPLTEVVKQLGKYYRKEFLITDSELESLSLTGTYKKQSLSDVLMEIELVLDVVFEESEEIILVQSPTVIENED